MALPWLKSEKDNKKNKNAHVYNNVLKFKQIIVKYNQITVKPQ
jgi:hypothetical protein